MHFQAEVCLVGILQIDRAPVLMAERQHRTYLRAGLVEKDRRIAGIAVGSWVP